MQIFASLVLRKKTKIYPLGLGPWPDEVGQRAYPYYDVTHKKNANPKLL